MPAPMLHGKKLWRYYNDHVISQGDLYLVEDQRKCPECPDGDMDRLARRQFHAPYNWIPIGYICNRCNCLYLIKDRSLV